MKDVYQVCLLGCGHRGRAQARAYKAHPRMNLRALCDIDRERLNQLGVELGVSSLYVDLDEMIRKERPDIVLIPTATQFHFPLAKRVLEHGCHIDVEKPVSEHLDQADELLSLARSHQLRIAVHHQWRTAPAAAAIAQALQEGRIGKLRYMYASGKGYYGGYGLPNIGTHLLNMLFELAGHVRTVAASVLTDGRDIGPEDVLHSPAGMGIVAGENVTALLEFENGVCATLLQHRFETMDLNAHVVEVYGSEGRLLWRPHGAFWLPSPAIPPGPNLSDPPGENAHWEPLEPLVPDTWEPGMDCQVDEYTFVDHYARALDEDRDHPSSGREGRHVLEVINAIFLSAVERRLVSIADLPRSHPLVEFRKAAGLSPEPKPAPFNPREWLAAEDRRLGR